VLLTVRRLVKVLGSIDCVHGGSGRKLEIKRDLVSGFDGIDGIDGIDHSKIIVGEGAG
jgi:hypothetical protein